MLPAVGQEASCCLPNICIYNVQKKTYVRLQSLTTINVFLGFGWGGGGGCNRKVNVCISSHQIYVLGSERRFILSCSNT